MYLKSLELTGFKSFAKRTTLQFKTPITAIVGPNGSGKSNIAEAFRFSLGEQRMTQMRSKRTEDLIWNGSLDVSRSRNASVTLTFDNSRSPRNARDGRLFDVDFDEVLLKRIIHRDSSTQYHLNGSPVRLKDIVELLSSAHIGSSGHHIISQGETDHILLVNSRERKAMVEDALGLKIYQYKKNESERKLQNTQQHKKEVESLRREIAPHLKFLKSQVEKVEKTRDMRSELHGLYSKYFSLESRRLVVEKEKNDNQSKTPKRELVEVSSQLVSAKEVLKRLEGADEKSKDLLSLEEKLSIVRKRKEQFTRELGQLEGEVRARKATGTARRNSIPVLKIIEFRDTLLRGLSNAEESNDVNVLKRVIRELREYITTFVRSFATDDVDSEEEYSRVKREKEEKKVELEDVTEIERKHIESYEKLKLAIEHDQHSGREAERKVFTLSSREQQLLSDLSSIESSEKIRIYDEEELEDEKNEARALVGELRMVETSVSTFESSEERLIMRKKIDRLKIRLEDAGTGMGDDILEEYEEVWERDKYLEKELADLDLSTGKLIELIKDLDERLNVLFTDGVKSINLKFQELFELTFGGGSASLEVVSEQRQDDDSSVNESEDLEGIEIRVSLPRKKIRGLHMLSGGERALTSIALLFAMSQVNPPPFLLLDETDAALDEANSRRYGDMIERLSKNSQLIVITHNRETMSRAGVLYGVTMGRDSVSQLLSVGFEEAVSVAK